MAALLALVSAAVFGAADFTGGYATRRTPVLTVTLLTNLVGALMAVGLVVVIGGSWTPAAVGWGAAGGAGGLAGIVCLYQGLASGPNRFVSPLSAVLAALLPVTVGIMSGERPGTLGFLGLALAAPAIWLVAGGDARVGGVARSTLLYTLGAGVGFGLFFTFLAQTPDDAGAVPLLAARTTSSLLVGLGAAWRRPTRPAKDELALPLLAGALDMTANGFYLWATREGDLAIVGALANLFPVTTILLAIVVLHERLTRPQAVGLALAVVTAALLS